MAKKVNGPSQDSRSYGSHGSHNSAVLSMEMEELNSIYSNAKSYQAAKRRSCFENHRCEFSVSCVMKFLALTLHSHCFIVS